MIHLEAFGLPRACLSTAVAPTTRSERNAGLPIFDRLDELIPILIAAPADHAITSTWLVRLFEAVRNDGVQYLAPVEDRWGEIARYPDLINNYADRLLWVVRRAWANHNGFEYVAGTAIWLSCLASPKPGRMLAFCPFQGFIRGMSVEMRRAWMFVRMACIAVLGSSLVMSAANAQTIASGDEVKAAFADKTAYITHRNGATQKAYFSGDGTAKVTEKSGVRAGTWTVEKNTICHNLSTERKCYTVTRKGPDTVELQSTDMKWLPSYRLVAGNPEKL